MTSKMFERIMGKFADSPSQRAVVRCLLERGFSVNDDGRVVSGGIEIPNTGIPRGRGRQTRRRRDDRDHPRGRPAPAYLPEHLCVPIADEPRAGARHDRADDIGRRRGQTGDRRRDHGVAGRPRDPYPPDNQRGPRVHRGAAALHRRQRHDPRGADHGDPGGAVRQLDRDATPRPRRHTGPSRVPGERSWRSTARAFSRLRSTSRPSRRPGTD